LNAAARTLSWMTLCAAGAVMAQQAPPQPPPPQQASPQQAPPKQTAPPAATAQSEAGEPRAETSNSPTPTPAPAPSAAAAASTSRAPAVRTPAAGRAAPVPAAGRKPAAKIDRLELGTATVTGDREQPKVMYIVPWKRSDIGDLAGKPMNSLVDEILSPVDRDVFKREVVYYRAVQTDASQNGASLKPAQQGEK
jgi:hypothetical protein